jgi:hypothetical protein
MPLFLISILFVLHLVVELRFRFGQGAPAWWISIITAGQIFVATGNVYPEVGRVRPEYPYKTPRLIFRSLGLINGGVKFEELIEEAGPGIAAVHSSRGATFGDFDNDGDLDVLIMNMNEPPSLLRNDVSGSGRWLKVLLIGTRSNRSAIGSRVTAAYDGKIQAQEVTAQSSFYSVNDRRLPGIGRRRRPHDSLD